MAATPRVSMATVARAAGVSGQTVSRVVNGSPRVDPATRARVEDAMATLGYRPHRAARTLRTGRSDAIGLVVATLESVGNYRMLQATAEEAVRRGLTLVLATAHAELGEAFEQLQAQGVDGAIVLNEASAHVHPDDVPESFPLVVIDAPDDSPFATVHSDHAGGARAATEHLLARGHETVWHIAGPEGSYAAAQREAGWRAALSDAGRQAPPMIRGDWSSHAGWAAVPHLKDATAVFAANDQMALGVLRGLSEQGIVVPDEVSIVGFDDLPEAAYFLPPLTTVGQGFPELARHAVELLHDALNGADIRRKPRVVPVELVVRNSTTPGESIAWLD